MTPDDWSRSTELDRLVLTHGPTGMVVTWPLYVDREAVARALRDLSRSMPNRPGPLRGQVVTVADVSEAIVLLTIELGRRPIEDEVADKLGYASKVELSRALRAMLLPGGRDRWRRLVTRALGDAVDRLRARSDDAYSAEVNAEDFNR